ncbi:hypothetical protein [Staphylococcus ureilyticus]|uniref:hypothetical protein n=1 Tax=Staphylococcus ureilyticus TaxID=94138 RepID=UPI0021CFA36C|nr:hypothetical protein [Staphylococcus ureilyticus]UXS59922.1 hypothetical protein MUA21_12620 [Staphylococcus ureilyticus]
MYSYLTHLDDEYEYRRVFYEEYCKESITTHHNIKVKFYPKHFDHAFYCKSDRRNRYKDMFDSERAKRILWIKQVLQDDRIPIFQGHDTKSKKSSPKRRVSLLTPDGYVVVIRMTGEDKAEFLTAFVVNESNVIDKIRSNPIIYNPKV